MIIALEGIDAAGKATHAKMLAEDFEHTEVIAFPNYDTPVGRAIYGNLTGIWTVSGGQSSVIEKNWPSDQLNALLLQCLMTINRIEMIQTIQNHIGHGKHIVFDRYWAAAVVYGSCEGLNRAWLEAIQEPLPEADVWVLIDIPVAESWSRRQERRDRYERSPGLLDKVRQGYIELFRERAARKEPWHIVDGVGSAEEVHRRILETIGVKVDRY